MVRREVAAKAAPAKVVEPVEVFLAVVAAAVSVFHPVILILYQNYKPYGN